MIDANNLHLTLDRNGTYQNFCTPKITKFDLMRMRIYLNKRFYWD